MSSCPLVGGVIPRALVLLLSTFIACMFPFHTCSAYDAGTTHLWFGEHSLDAYTDYAHSNYETSVDPGVLEDHWEDLAYGMLHEDDPVRYLNHFWNYDNGDNDGLWFFDSAYTVGAVMWNTMLGHYENEEYQSAYRYLGRIAHLVQDMGVPAHTHLDSHALGDKYETWCETENYLQNYHSLGLASGTTLHAIMTTVADVSSDFDSWMCNDWTHDPCGCPNLALGDVDQGFRRANAGPLDFTTIQHQGVAAACVPAAEEGVAALFRMFLDAVKPAVAFYEPGAGATVSGSVGVSFKAKAHSYEQDWDDADDIDKVKFEYYNGTGNPGYSDWQSAGEDIAFDGQYYYTYTWTNTINSNSVEVRAVAVDGSGCQSLPSKVSIKIDSSGQGTSSTNQP